MPVGITASYHNGGQPLGWANQEQRFKDVEYSSRHFIW